jgi:hypothetical protein
MLDQSHSHTQSSHSQSTFLQVTGLRCHSGLHGVWRPLNLGQYHVSSIRQMITKTARCGVCIFTTDHASSCCLYPGLSLIWPGGYRPFCLYPGHYPNCCALHTIPRRWACSFHGRRCMRRGTSSRESMERWEYKKVGRMQKLSYSRRNPFHGGEETSYKFWSVSLRRWCQQLSAMMVYTDFYTAFNANWCCKT